MITEIRGHANKLKTCFNIIGLKTSFNKAHSWCILIVEIKYLANKLKTSLN